MPWRISIEIWGEDFRPSRVPFTFTEQHDPNVVGAVSRYTGKPIDYGSASYEAPPEIRTGDRIRHIVETIEPLLPAIRAAGATEWHISIDRFYYAQCNEEYSLEQLQMIARLGCGFTYSAYSVSEDEERELQQKYEKFNPVA